MKTNDLVTEETQAFNAPEYVRPSYDYSQEHFSNPKPRVLSAVDSSVVHSGEYPREVAVGDTIKNRFVLTKHLGEGGMGKVFRALDKRKQETQDTNPYIAIKILGEDFKKHPKAFVALQREARKTQELSHPNIITVHDFDRDDNLFFLTMEELKGKSLKEFLISGEYLEMSRRQRLGLINQLVEGLGFAHSKGIVHSDLKPGNIFVGDNGVVKILDFGIARVANQDVNQNVLGASTVWAYSDRYASLEILNNERAHPSDDIYPLGIVICELLQGKHPFQSKNAKTAKTELCMPDMPSTLNPFFRHTLKRALSFERQQRIKDAISFKRHLRISQLLPKRLFLMATLLLTLGLANQYYINSMDLEVAIPFSALSEADQIEFGDYIKKSEQALAMNSIEDAVININKAYLIHSTNDSIKQLQQTVVSSFQLALDAADSEAKKQFLQKQFIELKKHPAFEYLEQ